MAKSRPVWSRFPKGNQFVLGDTRFFVAKPKDRPPLLIFQRAGEDICAVADFYSGDAADSFITAVLNGMAELPPAQLDAITEAGQKVTATQLGLGEKMEAKNGN